MNVNLITTLELTTCELEKERLVMKVLKSDKIDTIDRLQIKICPILLSIISRLPWDITNEWLICMKHIY